MTTLTSSATLAVGDGSTATESITLVVLPAIGTGTGRGRLIHPSLGTYDYPRSPDEWSYIDTDVINPPIWSSTKTLKGASSTLFVSDIQDVLHEERWTQSLVDGVGALDFVRMMIAMWSTPPDPAVAYVQWFPNYASPLGFNVILEDLTIGSKQVTLTPLIKQGYVRGPMVLTLRVVSRIS